MVSVNPEVVRNRLKLLEALEAALEWSVVNRYDILAKTFDTVQQAASDLQVLRKWCDTSRELD